MDYEAIEAMESEEMKAALPAEAIESSVGAMLEASGPMKELPLRRRDQGRAAAWNTRGVVVWKCENAKATFTITSTRISISPGFI
jgi:hypothetical protein